MVPGLILVAAAAMLATVAIQAVSVDSEIDWASAALTAYCTGLLLITAAVCGHDSLGLATWRLGPWSLVWAAFTFGAATISWTGQQYGVSAEILPGSILRALWMMAVAETLFTAGYCAGPFRVAAARASRSAARLAHRYAGEIRSPAVPWLLFAAGLAAQAAYAALTGYFGYVGNAASSSSSSGFGQYLAIAGECVPLAVAAAAVRAYSVRTPGSRLALAVLFAAACAAGAVAGGKSSFVVSILAVLIPRAATRRRLPAVSLTAAVLFFLLLVIPFNQSYRAQARGGTAFLPAGQAIAEAPAVLGQVMAADLHPATVARSARYLTQRVQSIVSPAIIIQRTPSQIPYISPAGLAVDPAADLIPRILWPGKPVLDAGYLMSQQYFDLPRGDYTSSDVTPEGDLWRHGGWVPLIAGMFLIGSGVRVLDDAADVRRGVHGTLLVILLFPAIVEAASDWAGLIAGVPGMILLWRLVVAFSFRRQATG